MIHQAAWSQTGRALEDCCRVKPHPRLFLFRAWSISAYKSVANVHLANLLSGLLQTVALTKSEALLEF